MDMREKFLPIGSVVLLKGGKKKAMITGFCSIAEEDKTKIYDYSGCIYPEGYLSSNQICLFNHDQIEKIFFIGYEDEEEQEFKKSLADIINDYEHGEMDLDIIDSFNNDLEEDNMEEVEDVSLDNDDNEKINFLPSNEDLEHL